MVAKSFKCVHRLDWPISLIWHVVNLIAFKLGHFIAGHFSCNAAHSDCLTDQSDGSAYYAHIYSKFAAKIIHYRHCTIPVSIIVQMAVKDVLHVLLLFTINSWIPMLIWCKYLPTLVHSSYIILFYSVFATVFCNLTRMGLEVEWVRKGSTGLS